MYNNIATNQIKTFFEYHKGIIKLQLQFPEANWQDSLSWGQINSKLWLIDELLNIKLELGTVFILGGWHGLLAKFMFNTPLKIKCIRSFDIDEQCWKIADTVNRPYLIDGWKFKAITDDVNNIDFTGHSWYGWSNNKQAMTGPITESPNTIINTSCEHMDDQWFEKIPNGKVVILQSNDFVDGEGHINIIKNINDMTEKYQVSTVLYTGEVKFEKYTRYMLIGIK